MSEKLLKVEHLYQYFPAGGFGKNKKYVQAVDDVSFFTTKVRRWDWLVSPDAEKRPPDVLF